MADGHRGFPGNYSGEKDHTGTYRVDGRSRIGREVHPAMAARTMGVALRWVKARGNILGSNSPERKAPRRRNPILGDRVRGGRRASLSNGEGIGQNSAHHQQNQRYSHGLWWSISSDRWQMSTDAALLRAVVGIAVDTPRLWWLGTPKCSKNTCSKIRVA